MSDTAIKFENISKQYRLGMIGTGTVSHDLNRWWNMNIRGKEDPNLKIGQVNDRATKSTDDYVWALRDIDFEVKQGEVLGIIGKNGAGKSTLLKILSRVTTPTTGRIIAYGRIASLLEVGTGFHPEMTGRENIYMNGSIMGMTKSEITSKLDEIVDFAGVEKYIDTPVKRYSSGMTVRLAFAIAAHLEPEILVVDEVLAVGDAEFQKKAIGKMQYVSKNDGRTVLFVSHNMASVQNLCTTGILLENGSIKFSGSAQSTCEQYLTGNYVSDNPIKLTKKYRSHLKSYISSISFYDSKSSQLNNRFKMGEDIKMEIGCEIFENFKDLSINVRLNDIDGNGIVAWRTRESNTIVPNKMKLKAELLIQNLNLFEGIYSFTLSLNNGSELIDSISNIIQVEILPNHILNNKNIVSKQNNLIYTPCKWNFS